MTAAINVDTEHVLLGEGSSVAAVLWLNRPATLNALNGETIHALDAALREADQDARVATVLVTGRGRAFSAGGDLKVYLKLQQDPVAFPAFIDHLHGVFGSIHSMRKPVVALVNGDTVAGGLELLLACDFAYAARSARIGDGHLNFGQIGGGGALTYLPRAIGAARARELIFSGRLLTATEALDWGLVNRVTEDDQLLVTGVEFARSVAEKSPAGLAASKYVLNAGWNDGMGVQSSLRLERERTALYSLTLPDSQEGLRAFAEKRAPRFPGR